MLTRALLREVGSQENSTPSSVDGSDMLEKVSESSKDYEFVKRLGAGAFGEVFVAHSRVENTTLVIKRIPKSKATRDDVENETSILEKLRPVCRKFILCFDGSFEDEEFYYIKTEFLGQYITVSELIKRTDFDEDGSITPNIIHNLVDGLRTIHENHIPHRDIKPDNIMVEPETGNIKYIDFGLACMGDTCRAKRVAGTKAYMAPELFMGGGLSMEVYEKADIYALGCTMYEMFFKETPFRAWLTHGDGRTMIRSLKLETKLEGEKLIDLLRTKFFENYMFAMFGNSEENVANERTWKEYMDNLTPPVHVESMLSFISMERVI